MILDIGSGTGDEWHKLSTGKDILHADIKRKAPHLELTCDVCNLPFPDNSIPIVHAGHLFEHLEDPMRALKEIKRVVQKFAIITVPNASFFKVRPSGLKEHIFSWNEWTLKTFLERVFENVEITKTVKWEIFGNWRFPKLQKLKRLFERWLFGRDELTAICRK